MRTMAATVAVLALAGFGTACGSGHGGAQHTPTAAPPRSSAAPAVVTPTGVQSLDDWLPAATSVLSRLTTDLHGLNGTMSPDPAEVPSSPDLARLSADARTGLRMEAPAGNAGVDRAWDRVMNDYLHVSDDLSSGDLGKASADLDTATTDTNVLQLELPSV